MIIFIIAKEPSATSENYPKQNTRNNIHTELHVDDVDNKIYFTIEILTKFSHTSGSKRNNIIKHFLISNNEQNWYNVKQENINKYMNS